MLGALLALGAISKTSLSMPLVTGSSPAKTDKKGLSEVLKNSLANLCASKDESGKVGTWLGIALGPILYEGSGNGAS